MGALLALVLALPVAPPTLAVERVQGEHLAMDLDTAPIANLTYQLDCLAALMPCSTGAYRGLWKEKLSWSDDDERALKEWANLKRKYRVSIQPRGTSPAPSPFPLDPTSIDLSVRLRIAGLVAEDLAQYRRAVRLLVSPADADRLADLVVRFWPRFDDWWQTFALRRLEPFLHASAELMRKQKLTAFYEQVERFYEADLPAQVPLGMHLILRPASGDKHTNGQQLENHAVVEVLEGERPEHRLDVVSHELFHYFYFSAPSTRTATVLQRFIDAPEADSMAAYGLLNEATATTFGNGLVAQRLLSKERYERLLAEPLSLYADEGIDRTAKALLAPLRALLEQGKTISDPAFATAFLAAARSTFGPAAPPSAYLRTLFLGYDPEFVEARQGVPQTFRAGSMFSSSPLDDLQSVAQAGQSPLLSGLLLVAPSHLDHLAKWDGVLGKEAGHQLVEAARTSSRFVYAFPRGPKAWLWVVVAPDATSMQSLLLELSQAERTAPGLWLPPASRPSP